MNKLLPFGLALVLLAGPVSPACADDEAKARTDTLLNQWSSVDESLLGTFHLGFYFNTKSMGFITMEVERTSEHGAAYKLKLTGEMKFGPTHDKGQEIHWLSADLSVIRSEENEENTRRGKTVKKSKVLELKGTKRGEEWFATQTKDGEKTSQRLVSEAKNHGSLAVRFLLARKISKAKAGSYEFQTASFPTPSKFGGSKPSWKSFTFQVPEGTTSFAHRGKTRTVKKLVFKEQGKEDTEYMAIDASTGEFLTLWPKDVPVKMISGTLEEAKKDLPAQAKSPDESSIRAAVKTYFEVLTKAKKVEALDAVVDWDAMHAKNGAGKDRDAYVEGTRKRFKDASVPIDKEMLDLISGMLQVKVKGDTAEVNIAGDDDKWILKKTGSGWKIVDMPMNF